ncbi:MAG: HNH endonuclease [Streptosporangiales bacterium]
MTTLDELAVREAAMRWLDDRTGQGTRTVTQPEVASFPFLGQQIPLLLRQQGICKPRNLDAALAIRTTWTPPGRIPPYVDEVGPEGLIRYAYRGQDPDHWDNAALRRAGRLGLPLVWFVAVGRGIYHAQYPVYVIADEPERLRVALAVDPAQRHLGAAAETDPDQRRYVERLNRLRLHQPIFRARVVSAYGTACAMCRLRHAELLDAAHILADTHPRGSPVVPNGLALCSIHHRAFDRNVLGVRPDLVVEVRRDILDEIDGPMLRYGLQEMHQQRLHVPHASAAKPDPTRLDERYEEFRAAS